MSIFTGSGVALITPFNDNENKTINYDAFARLIEFQIENQTDALIVCGTTGEASTLSDDEQIEAIRFAVEKAKKRVPVIAGAGSNDTKHGIELCKKSEKAGADACLLITPYYNKTTQKGLIEHFTATAAAIDIPIILYNLPGRTGLNMFAKTTAELSKIDNIVAIKEASGNMEQIAETAYLCGDGFDIYSGDDSATLPIMSYGGKGVISVVANVAPKQTHDMTASFLNGDIKAAAKLQLGLLPLMSALMCEVNPIPVKAALNMMGFGVGGYRAPLTTMEDANYNRLKEALKILS